MAAKASLFAFSNFITSYYTYNITIWAVNWLKNHCCISDSAPYLTTGKPKKLIKIKSYL
ncbi:hypothetical protein COO91_07518 [Nostoc flagelliforme CCNUN1]|uniref:Uncharacterized protein n=1 Tax=Nostoc flagelliforme CCNUN1 TaxID=2038116 RepID=A0A2K8T1F9_9NOSO|nr:hypothetical protein COO91_07518 [Nostoc flagelliforme CCNUN1]